MELASVTITKEQLNLFVVCAKHYLSTNIANKSILWVHLNTLLPSAIKKLKKVERERDFIRMKYCKKTASKHIEFDKRDKYQFTEEENKKVLAEFDRIDQEEIEVAQLLVPAGEYPQKGLSYDIRQAFTGIVIPKDEYEVSPGIQERLDEENKRVEAELAEALPVENDD